MYHLKPRFNRKSYTLVTAPASEPVSVAEAKTFLRVDGTAEDDLITSLIKTARLACENHTRRAFISQTWRLTMDAFSDVEEEVALSGYIVGPRPGVVCHQDIQLSRQPIQSITHIKTYSPDNTVSTVDADTYLLDTDGGRIVLNEGYTWPTNLRDRAAVEITFLAGYGEVPEDIRQAILLFVSSMYENRQCMDMPEGSKTLLGPHRLAEAFGAW